MGSSEHILLPLIKTFWNNFYNWEFYYPAVFLTPLAYVDFSAPVCLHIANLFPVSFIFTWLVSASRTFLFSLCSSSPGYTTHFWSPSLSSWRISMSTAVLNNVVFTLQVWITLIFISAMFLYKILLQMLLLSYYHIPYSFSSPYIEHASKIIC
jgi:hypothetical protein